MNVELLPKLHTNGVWHADCACKTTPPKTMAVNSSSSLYSRSSLRVCQGGLTRNVSFLELLFQSRFRPFISKAIR